MCIHEDLAVMMIKERMDDAMRYAAERRALRLAGSPGRPARVRFGMALIRLGRWLMGQCASPPGNSIDLPQTQS